MQRTYGNTGVRDYVRLCLDIAAAPLSLLNHNILSLKKPPYLPENNNVPGSAYQAALVHELSGEGTTMDTQACVPGGTWTACTSWKWVDSSKNHGDWDNERTALLSCFLFLPDSSSLRLNQQNVAGFVVLVDNLAKFLLFACLGMLTFSSFFSLSYCRYPLSWK